MTSATGPDPPSSATYAYDGASNRYQHQQGTWNVRTTTFDTAGMPISNDNGTPAITTDDVAFISDAEGNITDISRPAPGPSPKPEDGGGTSYAWAT